MTLLPATMKAVVTTGHGGYDRLHHCEVPVPGLRTGEVLLQVLAAGVNNTDVNLRVGWYSSTGDHDGDGDGDGDGGWRGASPFPLIQGADCCGRVVAVHTSVDAALIGRRALVRSCMRVDGFASMDTVWLGSDLDGAFAEYVRVPAGEVFPVECDWSDVELATIPCAYATAENMLRRAQLSHGERVVVTGASGGVGSAAVQLAARRGAFVIAVASAEKLEAVKALGAHQVVDRSTDVLAAVGADTVDLVIDNVAGPGFTTTLGLLRRGGRYVTSGAIAGHTVTLDLRTLYLRDITLIGTTAWDEPVFGDVVSYVQRSELRPVVAGVFPLHEIARAQEQFLRKQHVGNFVLVPEPG